MKNQVQRIFAVLFAFALVFTNATATGWAAEVVPLSTQTATTFAQLETHLATAAVTAINITGTLSGGTLNVNRTVTLTGEGTISFNTNAAQLNINSGGHLILDGPTITRSTLNNSSNGVRLAASNSRFTMRSGAVRGHHVGVVQANTDNTGIQITLEGGVIENNREGGLRAGRHTITTMSGTAIIRGNGSAAQALSTGGVLMNGGGTFNMSGGEITNNIGATGNAGGVTIGSTTVPASPGNFTMTGGRITDNRAPQGAAIRVAHNNAQNVSISAAAVFSGNLASQATTIRNDLFDTFTAIRPATVSAGYHAFSGHDIYVTNAPAPPPPVVVTGVVVTPLSAVAERGENVNFSAVVNGTGNPPQAVIWAVSGAVSSDTTISNNGVLTVSANETAASLTVTATSVANSSVSGSATVTVQAPAEPTLIVSSESSRAGRNVNVQIAIENNPGFASMLMRVAFPEDLTLVGYSLTDAYLYPSFTMPYLPSEQNHVFMGWVGRDSNIETNGALINLTFAVATGAALAPHPISITFESANNPGFVDLPTKLTSVPGVLEELNITVINGEISVLPTLLVGDLSGDGRVTSADATLLAQFLVGNISLPNPLVADINCDGQVYVDDLIRLARVLVGMAPTLCPHGGCDRCM
ncbi:MAG: dockerin type I domain-containing protein [Defluviitaleaceae bacterium]|nr:dockerin type I domain-containing protein [Defluviitaleaceae bacterium]MCL2262089.1 dockerin type I domain-containing protein [Defluviitaleaceae bacterium]